MPEITRRRILQAGAAFAVLPLAAEAAEGRAVRKGRLKQSVSRWCYKKIPDREFYRAVADLGLPAVDLLEEDQWAVVKEFGLVCSMGYGGGGTIPDGLNVKANHDKIVASLERGSAGQGIASRDASHTREG